VDSWTIPNNIAQPNNATPIGVFINTDPDYYNTCGNQFFSPPRVPNPRSGNGMIGFRTYETNLLNSREYIANRLDSVLQPGVPYEVEFYFTNGVQFVNGNPQSYYGGLGTQLAVYFSNSPFVQINSRPIPVTPDFETPTAVYSPIWQRISFTFTPTQPVQYICIGNFRNDANTISGVFAPTRSFPRAYYYIDDVSVTRTFPLATTQTEETAEAITEGAGRFFYADERLHFQAKDTDAQRIHLSVMDISGKVLSNERAEITEEVSFAINALAPGVYIAQLQTAEQVYTLRFMKN
jgi:hypothetical protein